MKSICITGANAPDLHQVAGVLHAAGMKSAKPAKPAGPADMAFWHEQVLAAAVEEGEGLQAFGNLGRLWEQMAADIFVANLKSEVWGWADTRSTWLLEFWLQFEPQLNFVLVLTPPHHVLCCASAVAADRPFDSVDDTMDTWYAYQTRSCCAFTTATAPAALPAGRRARLCRAPPKAVCAALQCA